MSPDIAFYGSILSVTVSASTLLGVAVRAGERKAVLERLDEEVKGIRERMHSSSNAFANVQVSVGELGVKVDNLTKAIERLDEKMDRHTENTNGNH